MSDIQNTVLRNLINNANYTRQVIPFIKKDYFEGDARFVFDTIVDFVTKYNQMPTEETLLIEMESFNLSPEKYFEVSQIVKDVCEAREVDQKWLLDTTEKWCKDRALFLAIMDSIEIMDGKKPDFSKDGIPDILREALGVSFDASVGHDYIANAEERFQFYNTVEEKLPFDLEYFNKITGGGIPSKTLTVCMAGTGVGKSAFMCHHASACLSEGKNVLYITMEMAEERIAERIDANLMDTPTQYLANMDKSIFTNKIRDLVNKGIGNLIIKEYPTAGAHVGHFRALLKELELKKEFKPDVIFIDYLNICASARMKMGGTVNTYSLVKAIAEEIRGLAVEYDVPIITATQTNRDGFQNSDVDLTNTSESFGLPATADLMFALVSTEELEQMGQLMVKQLKNRFGDINTNKRFVVGVDRSRMRFYDVENSGQDGLVQDHIPNDTKVDKPDFSGFKF